MGEWIPGLENCRLIIAIKVTVTCGAFSVLRRCLRFHILDESQATGSCLHFYFMDSTWSSQLPSFSKIPLSVTESAFPLCVCVSVCACVCVCMYFCNLPLFCVCPACLSLAQLQWLTPPTCIATLNSPLPGGLGSCWPSPWVPAFPLPSCFFVGTGAM